MAFATSARLHRLHRTRKAACSAKAPRMAAGPVLVTGATGFIGSHLVPELIAAGHEVHSLSRRPPQQTTPHVQHHQADITDAEALRGIFTSRDWYAVLHLAGLVSYTSADASVLHSVNVVATERIVNLIAEHCPQAKLIFCSSVAAVGSNQYAEDKPLDEFAEWDAAADQVAYLRTKRLAEEIVVAAAKQRRVRAAVLCPSNVYGSRDGKKGSRKTQVKAANGRWPVYTKGGVNVVHVRVVVQAFMRLVNSVGEKDDLWAGQRWLVVGENLTIKDMLGLCAEFGGNADYKPWLALPEWALWCICFVGQLLGSRTMTLDRFAVATRFHWFDGRRGRERLALDDIPAHVALKESVDWMIANGMVRPRSAGYYRQR